MQNFKWIMIGLKHLEKFGFHYVITQLWIINLPDFSQNILSGDFWGISQP